MKLPLAYRVRERMRQVGRAVSASELQPHFPGENVAMAMSAMYRDGILTREGSYRRFKYAIAREVRERLPLAGDDDRRKRKNARDRQAYAAMSPERKKAYLARKYARRQSQTDPEPSAPRPSAKKVQKPRPRRIVIPPAASTGFSAPPPAPKPRPETVEEWMARTGKKPEVLPGVGAALRDAA